jgi:hypothetical protein
LTVHGQGAKRTYLWHYGLPYNVARKHKTTLLLDADVWHSFHEYVTRRRGPRAVSREVEIMLRGTDIKAFTRALTSVFGPMPSGFPSLEEVEMRRPRLQADMTRLIREERDERDGRVLGLERPGSALYG